MRVYPPSMNSKMKRSLFFIPAICISLLMPSSCARYTAHPLSKPYLKQNHVVSQPVVVAVKKYSSTDSIHFLGRDVIKKGFQPLQITINNDSDRFLIFTKDNIDMPTIIPEEVAKNVETSTVGRATGYGVAALVIWPFLIPAIVDGVKSAKANQQLEKDYLHKAIDRLEIMPHTSVTGILFIPIASMKRSFTVNVIDRDTGENLSFPMRLEE